jgi:hypothetical protein
MNIAFVGVGPVGHSRSWSSRLPLILPIEQIRNCFLR